MQLPRGGLSLFAPKAASPVERLSVLSSGWGIVLAP